MLPPTPTLLHYKAQKTLLVALSLVTRIYFVNSTMSFVKRSVITVSNHEIPQTAVSDSVLVEST